MQTWAQVGTDGIVITVDVASADWVEEWREANPDSPLRWIETDPASPGYAAVGFTLDDETMLFIPPHPETPGDWYFDRDPEVWKWIDRDAPEDTPPES